MTRRARSDAGRALSREQSLIDGIFAPLSAGAPGAFGLKDDAAVLTPREGHEFVITTDAGVAGVHFLGDEPAGLIARKMLRVNLSDLAAKGADPVAYFLAIALPEDVTEAWLRQFAGGLHKDQNGFGCMLHGGDTVRTPGPLTVSITALGEVPAGAMVTRAGARRGDHVYVSGTIGDAALGLALARDGARGRQWAGAIDGKDREYLLERYRLPSPRVRLAPVLRELASAAIDISDGLAGDLAQLCRASNVATDIALGDLALSPAAARALAAEPSIVETLLTGGDDYEVLCAVPPARRFAFEAAAGRRGVPVTHIGRFAAGARVPRFHGPENKAIVLSQLSYTHL